MWVMGQDGLFILSPDGSTVIKETPKNDVCHNVTGYRSDEKSVQCRWSDIASDGKQYVFAAISRGISVVDVFDINTGDIVSTMPTCADIYDIDYHAGSQEMWVRCLKPDMDQQDFPGHIESFSTASISATKRQAIELDVNTTNNFYGKTVIHYGLGNTGYTTGSSSGSLYQLNLSTREVVAEHVIPGMSGANFITYSNVNKHLYFYARTCCLCGTPTAAKAECGRYARGNVTVTNGPNAGKTALGECGSGCKGTFADTNGIIEFDTNTNKVVASHFTKKGFGAEPEATPNGKYVVLFSDDKDGNVRILKAGKNGEKSTVFADVATPFERKPQDFAFVENKDGEEKIVIASHEANDVYIMDLTVTPPKVDIVALNTSPNTTSDRSRTMEWAVGTDYVWVSGSAPQDLADKEIYVVNVATKEVERTIKGYNADLLFYVENYVQTRLVNLMAEQQAANQAYADQLTTDTKKDIDTQISNLQTTTQAIKAQADSAAPESSNDASTVSIAALVVGLIALSVGVINVMVMMKKPAASPANAGIRDTDSEAGKESLQSVA